VTVKNTQTQESTNPADDQKQPYATKNQFNWYQKINRIKKELIKLMIKIKIDRNRKEVIQFMVKNIET